MWVRKTKLELENSKGFTIKNIINKIFNENISPLRVGMFFFIVVFTFLMAFDLFIGVSKGAFYIGDTGLLPKIHFKDIPNRLTYYFIMSFSIGFICYVLFYISKKNTDKKQDYICDKCNALKIDDGKYNCICGGEFLHIDKMKWIDND